MHSFSTKLVACRVSLATSDVPPYHKVTSVYFLCPLNVNHIYICLGVAEQTFEEHDNIHCIEIQVCIIAISLKVH